MPNKQNEGRIPKASYNKKKALDLWKQGHSMNELATKYGYCRSTIKKYLRLSGGGFRSEAWKQHQCNSKKKRFVDKSSKSSQTTFL